jgi:hypothetical protein
MLVLGFKKIIFRSLLPKLKLMLMQTGGRPHGTLPNGDETNGGNLAINEYGA